MVEVGIPVYKALDTLPYVLDSLVSQTKKNFIVCLSIDGDDTDYSEIIKKYIDRGLKIRTINSPENGGPGMARQRVLDTTQCDYIMFVDADDMIMPYTVDILYRGATSGGYDILRSGFIREELNGTDKVLKATDNIVTWFHGKIYRVQYLRQNDIRFLPGLRTDEDAYFNIIAWNCTPNKGYIDELTYIWRANQNSITRSKESREYFCKNYMNYIRSQVEGLKKIFKINSDIPSLLVGQTLVNIYYYYMTARFYNQDEKCMDNCISTLAAESWFKVWSNSPNSWIEVLNSLKAGQVFDNKYVVFYREAFDLWINRICQKGVNA